MSSVSISILENKKTEYENKIESARNSIASNEDAYDSLLEFKEKVQRSQEAFYTISTRENELLADIRPYYDYNRCAKTFTDVITRFLDSGGTKTVNFSYSALIRMISAQLKSIYDKIEDLNDDILRYRDKLEDVEEELEYQRSLEV